MRIHQCIILSMAGVAALITAVGCQSSPRRISYIIRPDDTLTSVQGGVNVYVSTVSMPSYLNRREIIRIVDGNRVEAVPGMAWAESPDSAVKRAMSQNLRRTSCCLSSIALEVDIFFSNLELTDNGDFHVAGRVQIKYGSNMDFDYKLPMKDFKNPACACDSALARLATEIVEGTKNSR